MNELDRTIVLIDAVILPRLRRAAINMGDGMDHHPSSGNGGGSSKGGHSDPVLNLVERHDEPWGRDTAAADRAQFDKHIRALADLVDSWAPNNVALAHRRSQVQAERGCKSCDRVKRDGVGHWEQVHARDLCKTCDRALSLTADIWEWDADMPPLGAVQETLATGKYVTVAMLTRHVGGRKRKP